MTTILQPNFGSSFIEWLFENFPCLEKFLLWLDSNRQNGTKLCAGNRVLGEIYPKNHAEAAYQRSWLIKLDHESFLIIMDHNLSW